MIQLGYTVPLVSLDSRFSVRACFTELIKEPNFRSLFAHVYGSELYISVYRSHKQARYRGLQRTYCVRADFPTKMS